MKTVKLINYFKHTLKKDSISQQIFTAINVKRKKKSLGELYD